MDVDEVPRQESEPNGKDSVYLCFFGDGPKVDNFVLTLSTPPGISNFRPFRYRDERVAPDVLEDMKSTDALAPFEGQRVILAARFGARTATEDGGIWKVLPLREVSVTFIDFSPDNHSIYFRAGALFDFRDPLGRTR